MSGQAGVRSHQEAVVGKSWMDRIGIPGALFWGFVGVLIFMIGDGVESNYIAPFIDDRGFTRGQAEQAITVYGAAVAIASWFSGTLSTIWGPRRVMMLGIVVWAVFEVFFLAVAIPSDSYALLSLSYGLRGLGYPLFAYGFLVWVVSATPTNQQGTAVGWFWFAFTGGLPTLGSLFASASIPFIGTFGTLWASLGLVLLGGLIAVYGVRERTGREPLTDVRDGKARELFRGFDIVKRHPKVGVAGIVRTINTTPEFGFFVILPFFFTDRIGFSQSSYLFLIAIIFATNIFANLFWGIVGDRFGWRRTVTYFGGAGCAITTLLLYYGPLAVGDNYAVAVVCGMLYGFMLAGYVPLSALTPSMVETKDKGNAMAILNLGAGLAVFVGPAIVAVFRPLLGISGVVWIFTALYVASAVLSFFLYEANDPGEVSEPEDAGAVTSA